MEVKHRLLNFKDAYIYQNTDWFNMSLDSLLLVNFVTIKLTDKHIIDLCSGNAPIPMLLTYKTSAMIVGVELQKEIYNLGIKSIKENKMDGQVNLINDNVLNLENDLYFEKYDIVTCNPPYFRVDETSNLNDNNVKRIARHEVNITLDDVIRVGSKLLKNKGTFALVHRPDRLIEIIDLFKKYKIEPKKMQFVYPKIGKNSNMVLIEGVKNGRSGLKILPSLVTHNDNNTYNNDIRKMFGE